MGNVTAGPLSAVTPALSIVSGIMKGEGQQSADDFQAAKLKQAAEYGRAAGSEADVQLRENLNNQLSNIDAVRAAANIDPTSPTTAALKDRTAMIGDRSRSIQVGNIMAKAAQDEADSNYLTQAGSFAYTMGALGGVTAAAGTVAKGSYGGGSS